MHKQKSEREVKKENAKRYEGAVVILIITAILIMIYLTVHFLRAPTKPSYFIKHAIESTCKTPKQCDVSIDYKYSRSYNPAKTYDAIDRQVLRVLFIGNSYTFPHGMTDTFAKISHSDPNSNFYVQSSRFAKPGETLSLHLMDDEIDTVLAKKKWDYVILQPQSLWASQKQRGPYVNNALSEFTKKIRALGAKPVFFMTWPREPNKGWYKSFMFGATGSPEIMLRNLKEISKFVTNQYHMILAPIGYYWAQSYVEHPELKIYMDDGTHPSQEGAYLTALMFYKLLVNPEINNIENVPDYINDQEKAAINDIIHSFTPIPEEMR